MSSSAPAPQSASSASPSMSASTATAPAENVVVLDDVVAGYLPGVNILNGANLTAAKGELIGIIGPNGAGKSTMLKAIFGQVKIRSGSVVLNGEVITGLRANKLVAKGVGFVPQTNNVFPSLTIAENLQMGAAVAGMQHFDEDLETICTLFPRVKERLQQRGGTLSGGEQQMVAIARALMARPKLILMDEPSMGLSPLLVKEVFAIIKKLNQRRYVITTEHRAK